MPRPMYDMLARAQSRLSLHMPGGQGRAPFGRWDAFRMDTTETPATDNLYQPTGAIAEAQRLLAKSAGAANAFLLHGGSTAGIQAMLLYACQRGDSVVLPRNAHLSVLNLCAVAGINPVFAEPSVTPQNRVYTTPEAYARALDAHPQATAVVALHTDYYGLRSDLRGLAECVHARKRLLLCDEAHAAYCNWRADMPNAIRCGADLAVQSAHKTLPALTACAWLLAGKAIDAERLRARLRMVQTSSPSFALMLAEDDAREWMDQHGATACERLERSLTRFRGTIRPMGFTDGQDDGQVYDRLRLVIGWPCGGAALEHALATHGIDVEMSDERNVVCILSLMDGERRLRRLERVLREIARQAAPIAEPMKPFLPKRWPQRCMPIDEAAFAQSEPLLPMDALGRISAVTAGPYPPGTAWLTPGDEVTEEIARQLANDVPERLFGLTENHMLRCIKARE